MTSNSRGECKFFNTIQGCHAVGCGFAHTLIPGISYCQFFNTAEGCRRGNSCGFIHSPLAGPRSMPSPLSSPYGPGLNATRGHRPPRPFIDHRKFGAQQQQLSSSDLANPPPSSNDPNAIGLNARLPSFAPSTVGHPHVNMMEGMPSLGLAGGGYRTSNTKNPNPMPLNHTQGASLNHNGASSSSVGANGSLSVFEEPLNNPRFNQLCHFFNTAQGCKYGNDCGYMHKIIKKNVTVCHFFGSAKGCQAPTCGFVHNMTLYQQ